LNSFELAREKFNALFTTHAANDKRAAAQQQKLSFKTGKKTITKKIKQDEHSPNSR
jgi:hypothetical protein